MTIFDKIRGKGKKYPWWSRWVAQQPKFALDLGALIMAFILAYLLRFDFSIPPDEMSRGLSQLPFVVCLQFALLYVGGIYTFVWRYIGMAEIKAFIYPIVGAALPLLILRLCLPDRLMNWRVPLSILVIDGVLALGSIVGLRVLRRAIYERYEKRRRQSSASGTPKRPVLLIGAGRAGVMVARELRNNDDIGLDVRGFVDDDPMKQRCVICGVRVLGTVEDLSRLVKEHHIDHVIISVAEATRAEFRRILDFCEQVPVKVRTIPGLFELLQGKVEISRIRSVQIEDLLGRPAINLDEESMRSFLFERIVMVTGAGGSIGSELARQVAHFTPSQLLLVERSEFALFNIERELRELYPQLPIVPLVLDVGDEPGMRVALSAYHPEIIVHAAAHKHVPMMENNPCEAVKNNVLATYMLGTLAAEFGVESFVLISTDKAVRPTSVMGASKRVAELIIQYLNSRHQTRYVAVRFGNVIGSAGSVIPLFREQIQKGGPVKVTHPEMMRYFMTIPEAAQLVLQASAIGEGGEIFILDMGDPVRILDLAKDTITLSGLKPFEDIDIVFTGVRPGEKLFEELDMTGEVVSKTRHPKIFIGRISACSDHTVQDAIAKFKNYARMGAAHEIRRLFNQLLPEATLEIPRTISQSTRSEDAPSARHAAVG